MSQPKRDYDSTVARIAGNIASGLVREHSAYVLTQDASLRLEVVAASVILAREIVDRTRCLEPERVAP